MKTIELTVPGEPKGKARPRVTRTGVAYTPTKTVNYETFIKGIFTTKDPDFMPSEKSLGARIIAYLLIPKATSKKKTLLMESGIIRPAKSPDVDNIVKMVMDALEGLAYKRDSQVVSVNCKKYYGQKPRLEISIKETSDVKET